MYLFTSTASHMYKHLHNSEALCHSAYLLDSFLFYHHAATKLQLKTKKPSISFENSQN